MSKELMVQNLRNIIINGEGDSNIILKDLSKNFSNQEIILNILFPVLDQISHAYQQGNILLLNVLKSLEVINKIQRSINTFSRSTILVATLTGDMHNSGKSLLKIILKCYYYNIIDLGKEVSVEFLVGKVKELTPNFICLPIFLLTTTTQIKELVSKLHSDGLRIPIIIGGPVAGIKLIREIQKVNKSIFPVMHCGDAFAVLKVLSNGVFNLPLLDEKEYPVPKVIEQNYVKPSKILKFEKINPPFLGVKIINDVNLVDIFPLLNLDYVFKLGWRIRVKKRDDYNKLIKEKYYPLLNKMKNELARVLSPKIIYGYFKCEVRGDEILIFDNNQEIERFDFPRQKDQDFLCLADYFNPTGDIIAFHAVTIGDVAKVTDVMNSKGEFSRAFLINGVCLEAAEALAEYTHNMIKQELKLGDKQGKRYSFGYPACPRLEDQIKLWKILRPDRIGIKLTPTSQMNPEFSTSALIVHHKDAVYFNV